MQPTAFFLINSERKPRRRGTEKDAPTAVQDKTV